MYKNTILFIITIFSFFFISCADMDIKGYNGENQKFNPDPNYSYEIEDKLVIMSDEAVIHTRFYHKNNDFKPLLFLIHGEDEVLEDWNMLAEYFVNDINVLSMDIRGYGRSSHYTDGKKINVFDFDENDYRKLTDDILAILHLYSYETLIFIGSGIGANIILKTSSEICEITSDFILVSPVKNSSFLPIESFDEYCTSSNHLYINNESNTNKTEQKDNVKKLIFYTDKTGIDLVTNNSIIIKEIKDRIKKLE